MAIPKALSVVESTPFEEAESPYARTKQMGEQIIRDFSKKEGNVKIALLRYFNPVKCDHSLGLKCAFSISRDSRLGKICQRTKFVKESIL